MTISRSLATRLTLVLAVFALYTLYRFGIDQVLPPRLIPGDYANMHRAAERFQAGELFYRPEDTSPYKYSPTFLVAFTHTLHQFPRIVAWFFWCVASTAWYIGATRWLWLATPELGKLGGRALTGLMLAFGIFHWHGYIEHFSYGQADMFVFGAFIAAAAVSRDWLSSAIMSALLITKPQSAILLSYFLIAGRYRMLGLTAAMTMALLIAPAAAWGFPRLLEVFGQWKHCLANQDVPFLTGNHNQTLASSIARWSGHREIVGKLSTAIVALAAAAVVTIAARRPRFDKQKLAIFTMMLYALVTPLSWRWLTFIWLPIGVICAARAWLNRDRLELTLLGLFAVLGTLLQKHIAAAIGIAEVDDLSFLGFYTMGNLILFICATRAMYRSSAQESE